MPTLNFHALSTLQVYIDLTPLLWKDGVTEITGWIPIYDTMHGMRGEINIIVKVELFEDVSRFRQSSVGVQFFNCKYEPRKLRGNLL